MDGCSVPSGNRDDERWVTCTRAHD